LTVLLSLVPGLLLIFIYMGLLNISKQPLPLIFEEHLGSLAGKSLGLAYVLIFITLASLYLRFYQEFISNNVLIGTALSLLLLIILIPGFFAIRCGLLVIGRVSVIVLLTALPLAVLLLVGGLTESPDYRNILPITQIDIKGLLQGIYTNLWHFGNMIVILTLFQYTNQNHKMVKKVLIIVIAVLGVYLIPEMLIITMVLGAELASIQTFALFEIARNVDIGGFIRNTEIIFISSFLAGIFISIIMFWFMACYSIQQVFNLKDYRFLAAPVGLIIAFGAILISPNTRDTFKILGYVAPFLYGISFIIIPMAVYLLAIIKAQLKKEPTD
jgi:spore germination protein KB